MKLGFSHIVFSEKGLIAPTTFKQKVEKVGSTTMTKEERLFRNRTTIGPTLIPALFALIQLLAVLRRQFTNEMESKRIDTANYKRNV